MRGLFGTLSCLCMRMYACEHACVRVCGCVCARCICMQAQGCACVRVCTRMCMCMHACAHAYMCMWRTAPAYTAAPPQRTLLLLMPEVSLGLQMASSLLLLLLPALLHPLCCPVLSNPPSDLLSGYWAWITPTCAQAVCAARGPSRPLPVHAHKIIIILPNASFARPFFFSYYMCSWHTARGWKTSAVCGDISTVRHTLYTVYIYYPTLSTCNV